MNINEILTGRFTRLKLDAVTRKRKYLELVGGLWLYHAIYAKVKHHFPDDSQYAIVSQRLVVTHNKGHYKIVLHDFSDTGCVIEDIVDKESKMKLKKSRKAGVCDAMRCAEPSVTVNSDGTKFCMRHAGQYMNGDKLEVEADEPQNAIATPVEAEVKEAAAPDLEYADAVIAKLGSIEIKNQGMLDKVGELLTDIKARHKVLESQRTDATKPLNKAKRTIDGWFKPATSRLKECEGLLKTKINAYSQRLFDEKQKALTEGDHKTAIAAAPAELPENMSQRTVLDYRIVDLNQVPREYLTLDHSAVKIALGDQGRDLNIPGIEVYEKPILTVRS